MPVAISARLSAMCLIFIGVGWFLFSSANIFNLELHAHIRLKDLVLVERIDLDIA
jgi:cbb3-type cytochrome oxidase subunit 3